MIHDPRPKRQIDAVRRVDEKIRSQCREGSICKRNNDEQNTQHIECGERILNQNLVDDDLRQHWIGQTKKLNKKRRNKDFN